MARDFTEGFDPIDFQPTDDPNDDPRFNIVEIPPGASDEDISRLLSVVFSLDQCDNPECNFPKDPEVLAALAVATFVTSGDDYHQMVFMKGLAVHKASFDALCRWTLAKLEPVSMEGFLE